jgi:diketogulonate reductase-like aldo/keto reductase
MIYKTIGESKVPVIGLGTGGIKDERIFKQALELGYELFDTAESYGNEELLGRALKGKRDKVLISSKFSPEHNGYDDVIKSCESSLKRLGTDYIDFYSMHYLNPGISIRESIQALYDLKEQGKIKNYGVCNVTHKQVETVDIHLIQNEYSLYERSTDVLGHCEKHNILFMAYSPLKDLYSLPKDGMLWLQEIATNHQKTLAKIALSWIVSHKNVIALPRATNYKHLKENLEVIELSKEEIEKIDKLFPYEISYIPVSEIKITRTGKFPQTLEEAQNWSKWAIKPQDLDVSEIKPIRVEEIRSDYQYQGKYELLEGALSYWAWVLKRSDPIPCLVKRIEETV